MGGRDFPSADHLVWNATVTNGNALYDRVTLTHSVLSIARFLAHPTQICISPPMPSSHPHSTQTRSTSLSTSTQICVYHNFFVISVLFTFPRDGVAPFFVISFQIFNESYLYIIFPLRKLTYIFRPWKKGMMRNFEKRTDISKHYLWVVQCRLYYVPFVFTN